MSTCHACKHELIPAAILDGKCPHCGALLRKLSQRTIDSKGLRGSDGEATATGVRVIWTSDHLDAVRRLQDSIVKPAQAAVSERALV